MSLNNIKNMKKNDGFTIVELLIVIVVIGILAAITIVAYNGVQNRAKTASAQSLAETIEKKAEAWNAVKGSYPTLSQLTTGDSTVPEAKLDDTTSVQAANPTDEKKVGYKVCVLSSANVGVIVTYFTAPTGTAVTNGGTTTGTGVACS